MTGGQGVEIDYVAALVLLFERIDNWRSVDSGLRRGQRHPHFTIGGRPPVEREWRLIAEATPLELAEAREAFDLVREMVWAFLDSPLGDEPLNRQVRNREGEG